jgi:nitroreductase
MATSSGDDSKAPHIPLDFERLPEEEMVAKAKSLHAGLARRRSVRVFSDEPIPMDAVREAIMAAAQSPSGAHKQPWTFALVTDPEIKQKIRVAAEAEEAEFYERRAPQQWLDDLQPFATNASKPYLETAPALIVIFAQSQGEDGEKHYYVKESVGIAAGVLIASLHLSGLATLTHTPSPMTFLREILERPENERPFLLLPVGYPAKDCEVPDLTRKSQDEVIVEF